MVQTNAAREDRRQHPKQGAEILGIGPREVNGERLVTSG
jgi:hypothetical protein